VALERQATLGLSPRFTGETAMTTQPIVRWAGLLLVAGLVTASRSGLKSEQAAGRREPAPAGHAARNIRAAYAQLPLAFEANQGQTDSQVKFLSRGPGYGLYLTPGEAVLSLRSQQPEPNGGMEEWRN
jgi:hypothetical protein